MVVLENGDVARYCITVGFPNGADPSSCKRLLDKVDVVVRGNVEGGVRRDGLNRWYLGYDGDDSLGMPTLLATGKALGEAPQIKSAGLGVFWDEPGWPTERL